MVDKKDFLTMNEFRVNELKSALKQELIDDFLPSIERCRSGEFINLMKSIKADRNTKTYDNDSSIEIFRNYLEWLFATFREDERLFRKSCLERFGNLNSKNFLLRVVD